MSYSVSFSNIHSSMEGLIRQEQERVAEARRRRAAKKAKRKRLLKNVLTVAAVAVPFAAPAAVGLAGASVATKLAVGAGAGQLLGGAVTGEVDVAGAVSTAASIMSTAEAVNRDISQERAAAGVSGDDGASRGNPVHGTMGGNPPSPSSLTQAPPQVGGSDDSGSTAAPSLTQLAPGVGTSEVRKKRIKEPFAG